jgi:methylenetetrahydrofolate dehydrogenase (NADP+)/methenyltetrahydrofolate cyclohydrolase
MTILDGKKTSNDIKNEIALSVKEIVAKGSRPPHLAAVIVGEDGASLTYVGSKVRACKNVGFDSTLIKLSENISEQELLLKVKELNENDAIDGYIVQLPLPFNSFTFKSNSCSEIFSESLISVESKPTFLQALTLLPT